MTDGEELNELCERIGRLGGRDQARLFEMVLAENRRRWDEEVARQQAAVAALLEFESRNRTPTAPSSVPPEAKREAG